jgi:hypothetical protein
MTRPGATHRAAAPSCTPATRDRTGRSTATFTGVRPPAGTPACSMIPGWRPPPGPGSPGVRRHPAGSPAIPEPGPRARRHPGVPAGLPFTSCAVTLDQLHRQGTAPVRQARRTGTPAHHGNPGRPCRRHVRVLPHAVAMYGYTGWAAGHVCDGGTARAGLGMVVRCLACPCPSVSTPAGEAGTASGRVAGQSECLSRKRWRRRDDRAGRVRGRAGHAGICSVHVRIPGAGSGAAGSGRPAAVCTGTNARWRSPG